jgi:hypothetical protein
MPPLWVCFVSTILAVSLIWYPALWLLGQADGWGDLARHYRCAGSLPPARQRFANGKVGSTFLSNLFEIAAQPDGLYLTMPRPFAPGHPPLLIPWEAVTYRVRQKTWLRDWTQLFVSVGSEAEPVPITLDSSLLNAVHDQLPPIQPGEVRWIMSWSVIALRMGLFVVGLFLTWGIWLGGFF